MKKFLLLAAAALMAFSSCTEEVIEEEKKDSIELSSNSATFTKEPGNVKVIVTSSGEWKLTSKESYDWATPSAFKGVDGDIVKFEVVENVEADRQAVYTFTCGTAKADFTITSIAGEKPAVKLLGDANIEVGYEANDLEVKVTAPIAYRKLKVEIAGNPDWISRKATLPGDTDEEAKIMFKINALEGLDGREAKITISGEELVPAELTVKQLAKEVLSAQVEFYKAAIAGGEVVVPLITNVEYKIEIAKEAQSWLSYVKKGDKGEIFKATKLEGVSRSGEVTFTQTNAKKGAEPLKLTVKISQIATLIHWAADMHHNRLFPQWVKAAPSANQNPCTVEALVYINEFENELNTVMGVEGKFLLRFGDAGKPNNVLQIATDGGRNLEFYDYPFETNKWYHIAAVFDGNTVTVYRDGVELGSLSTWLYGVPLGNPWSYEPYGDRCWWYGYSYNPDRGLNGMMTELRMWGVALTKEQINAENHFYTVDPESEGLISYWKFTEGEGNVIADKSKSKGSALGEALYGEINVANHGRENYGEEGIKWVKVDLPEK